MLCNRPPRGARRSGATASVRACANTAQPTEAHSQGAKDHRAAPICTATPPTANGRRHPRPPAVQHLQDVDRPRCSSQARPRRRRREAADMESRPSDGPLRLQRSAPPPGHRLHPRYGESAIQISSQCDARTNEFPDFKASGTAKCLPVISTQNAESALSHNGSADSFEPRR